MSKRRLSWSLSTGRQLAGLCLILGLAGATLGCVRPTTRVPNYIKEPMPVRRVPYSVTRKAIERGALNRGWQLEKHGARHVVATYHKGRLMAALDIYSTPDTYTIRYRDSRGFHYNPQRGSIHSRFGIWVRNLRASIRSELDQLRPRRAPAAPRYRRR